MDEQILMGMEDPFQEQNFTLRVPWFFRDKKHRVE